MKRYWTGVALCLLLGCAAPPAPETARDSARDEAAIRALSDARTEAFRQGDAAAIAARFTEDGLLMAPGAPAMQGREAVRAYYQKLFDEFELGLESGYDEVSISGDLAYGRGFAKVTARPKTGGPPVVSTAKYLNLLRRQPNGAWLTTHDIWNANDQ
jgi:uncharacterized protein (TIGR02246 family)